MEDSAFDRALITAVFEQASLVGWADVNLAEAAREAGLPVPRVRARFPNKSAVLLRFGVLADEAAMAGSQTEPMPRDRLFDMLMARFDAIQQHRAGVLSMMVALRTDPGTAALLYAGTLRSMRWLLDAAAIPVSGLLGALRVQGLLVLWLYVLRAWEQDDSPDLTATMAAVDRGLDRALRAEALWPGRVPPVAPEVSPIPESDEPAAMNI